MANNLFTGNLDLDFLLLSEFIDDNDLKNCILNQSLYSIVNDEKFWKKRCSVQNITQIKPNRLAWKEYYFFCKKYPYEKDKLAQKLELTEEDRYIRRMIDEKKAVEGVERFPIESYLYFYYALLSDNEYLIKKFTNSEFYQWDIDVVLLLIKKKRFEIFNDAMFSEIFDQANDYKFNGDIKKILRELGKGYFLDYYKNTCENWDDVYFLRYFISGLIEGHHNEITKQLIMKNLDKLSWKCLKSAIIHDNKEIKDFLDSKGYCYSGYYKLYQLELEYGKIDIETYKRNNENYSEDIFDEYIVLYYYKHKDYDNLKKYLFKFEEKKPKKPNIFNITVFGKFDIYTCDEFIVLYELHIAGNSWYCSFLDKIQYKTIKVSEYVNIFKYILKINDVSFSSLLFKSAIENNRRDILENILTIDILKSLENKTIIQLMLDTLDYISKYKFEINIDCIKYNIVNLDLAIYALLCIIDHTREISYSFYEKFRFFDWERLFKKSDNVLSFNIKKLLSKRSFHDPKHHQ